MMTGDDYRVLVSDIRANGLLEPITLCEGKILDGRNRYAACLELGIEPRYREWNNESSPIAYVVSLNLARRHLTSSQRAVIALEVEKQLAEERKKTINNGEIIPQFFGKTSDITAKIVDVNPHYITDAKRIAQEAPEYVEKIRAGEMTIPEVKRIINRQDRIERIQEISAGNGDIETHQRYPVIYADPPWRYEHSLSSNREIENHYPTMPTDEICALPIGDLANDDAVLFVWATNPKLEDAMQVISAWGFSYRTNMVWVKDKIGMGYYARQKHELLLIATRGQLPTPEPENRPASVIEYPRTDHSKKPEPVYEIIEGMYPELSKIELFARNKRKGWNSWGNQI